MAPLRVPIITEQELRDFGGKHFPNAPQPDDLFPHLRPENANFPWPKLPISSEVLALLQPPPLPLNSTEELAEEEHNDNEEYQEENYQEEVYEEEDDELGYYSDGAKRTLTDAQIKYFKMKEILKRLRQYLTDEQIKTYSYEQIIESDKKWIAEKKHRECDQESQSLYGYQSDSEDPFANLPVPVMSGPSGFNIQDLLKNDAADTANSTLDSADVNYEGANTWTPYAFGKEPEPVSKRKREEVERRAKKEADKNAEENTGVRPKKKRKKGKKGKNKTPQQDGGQEEQPQEEEPEEDEITYRRAARELDEAEHKSVDLDY